MKTLMLFQPSARAITDTRAYFRLKNSHQIRNNKRGKSKKGKASPLSEIIHHFCGSIYGARHAMRNSTAKPTLISNKNRLVKMRNLLAIVLK